MRKIKVAQVLTKGADSGTEVVVRNYCQALGNRVDWLILIENECRVLNEKVVSDFGGKLFLIPPYSHFLSYEKRLKEIFLAEKPDIVHANLSTVSFAPLMAAKKAQVPVRIAHSHTMASPGEGMRNVLKKIFRKWTMHYCNDYFCCSQEAGEFQFGKRVDKKDLFLLPNAFPKGAFSFSEEARREVRERHGLSDDCLILGFVGRLERQKNPLFLIDVLKELRIPSVLLVLGEGSMKEEMESKAKSTNVDVRFCGTTTDVSSYYSAMDILLAPSLFEGFGNVVLEGQANGLDVLLSENFPKSVCLEERICHVCPLDASFWAKEITYLWEERKKVPLAERRKESKSLDLYDIDKAKERLLKRYQDDLERLL